MRRLTEACRPGSSSVSMDRSSSARHPTRQGQLPLAARQQLRQRVHHCLVRRQHEQDILVAYSDRDGETISVQCQPRRLACQRACRLAETVAHRPSTSLEELPGLLRTVPGSLNRNGGPTGRVLEQSVAVPAPASRGALSSLPIGVLLNQDSEIELTEGIGSGLAPVIAKTSSEIGQRNGHRRLSTSVLIRMDYLLRRLRRVAEGGVDCREASLAVQRLHEAESLAVGEEQLLAQHERRVVERA